MNSTVTKTPVRVALVGAGGRMGLALEACASRDPGEYQIAVRVRRGDRLPAAAECDAVVDFSTPDATAGILASCLAQRLPLILGTTGHDTAGRAQILAAGREIPIVFAANFSVGVNALFWLTREAVRVLGPDFDLEVVEMHHRLKKDAPSGTARRLVEILAEARGIDPAADARHGREGLVGARPPAEIGVHAVRGGDVVGEHTVFLAGAGERLELTHRAASRETFAAGALRAARWVVGRPPALYDMEDVLGLRSGPANPGPR